MPPAADGSGRPRGRHAGRPATAATRSARGSAASRGGRDARAPGTRRSRTPSAASSGATRGRAARWAPAGLKAAVENALTDPAATRVLEPGRRNVPAKVRWSDLRKVYRTVLTIEQRTFKLRLFKRLRARRGATASPSASRRTRRRPEVPHHKQVDPIWTPPDAPWAGELPGSRRRRGGPHKTLGTLDGAHGRRGDPRHQRALVDRHPSSHGCIRMPIPDVVELYRRVPHGRAGLPSADARRRAWATMRACPVPMPSSSPAARPASAGHRRASSPRRAGPSTRRRGSSRRSRTSRRKGCQTLALDVCDEASMSAAVEAVEQARRRRRRARQQRRLRPSGAVERRPDGGVRRQFETNVFGLSACASSCCPACASSAGAAS